MPQGYVKLGGVARPFTLDGGDTPASVLRANSPVAPLWSDGTADPVWAAGTKAVNAYGGFAFDTTLLVWSVLVVKGTSAPVLAHEADFLTFDAVLAAAGFSSPTWAEVARVEGKDWTKVSQI